MKTIEYIYQNENNTINVIQLKSSQNAKIGHGLVIQTYHFSIDQIVSMDMTNDKDNCLNCPLSFSNGHKLGKCYTHKGLQFMGLKSMLKRLNKIYTTMGINGFSKLDFDMFLNKARKQDINLVRFGAYGEPVLLGEHVVNKLAKLGQNITGYTHTYKNSKFAWSNKYFMASTHTSSDKAIAKLMGYRQFNVIMKNENVDNSINCPSSKESEQLRGKKVSCINCSLCSGNYKGLKKDIHILVH